MQGSVFSDDLANVADGLITYPVFLACYAGCSAPAGSYCDRSGLLSHIVQHLNRLCSTSLGLIAASQ